MIVIRDVFHAKYGRGDELVALFKEMGEMAPNAMGGWRILVDLSGRFFQVITEMEAASLAEYEQMVEKEMSDNRFADWFARMMEVTEGGQREFYRVVS